MDQMLALDWTRIVVFATVMVIFLLLLKAMFRLVGWSKKRPKGGYILIALMPLISIFPIPGQEVKKLEAIKKEQVKQKQANGEPKDDAPDDMTPE